LRAACRMTHAQRAMSRASFGHLRARAADGAPLWARARIMGFSDALANAWLRVCPNAATRTQLRPFELRAALRARLLLPVLPTPIIACGCTASRAFTGAHTHVPFAADAHARLCRLGAAQCRDAYFRPHDAVRDEMAAVMRFHFCCARQEVRGLLTTTDGRISKARPGDLVCVLAGKHTAIDVTRSELDVRSDARARALAAGDATLSHGDRVKAKLRKYAGAGQTMCAALRVLTVGAPCGETDEQGHALLGEMAAEAARTANVTTAEAKTALYGYVSLGYQRALGMQYASARARDAERAAHALRHVDCESAGYQALCEEARCSPFAAVPGGIPGGERNGYSLQQPRAARKARSVSTSDCASGGSGADKSEGDYTDANDASESASCPSCSASSIQRAEDLRSSFVPEAQVEQLWTSGAGDRSPSPRAISARFAGDSLSDFVLNGMPRCDASEARTGNDDAYAREGGSDAGDSRPGVATRRGRGRTSGRANRARSALRLRARPPGRVARARMVHDTELPAGSDASSSGLVANSFLAASSRHGIADTRAFPAFTVAHVALPGGGDVEADPVASFGADGAAGGGVDRCSGGGDSKGVMSWVRGAVRAVTGGGAGRRR